MRAGRMRHRVRIEQLKDDRDDSGEVLACWKLYREVWASMKYVDGRETYSPDTLTARQLCEFRMRYVDGFSPSMRLVWDGRAYNVLAVSRTNGVKAELVVLADEFTEASP